MIGITDDHEIKTINGWKKFEDIDIKRDKLYCWKFNEFDDDPCGLNYIMREINDGTITRDISSDHCYIEPLEKTIKKACSNDLFHIKNDFIDLIATSNYKVPAVIVSPIDRYDNFADLDTILEYYKAIESWSKKPNDDRAEFYFLSEKAIKEVVDDWFSWENIMVKLELSHFTILTAVNKSIINFTLPSTGNNKLTWRIYVRRNGKEFWV